MVKKRGIDRNVFSDNQRKFWIGFVTVLLLSVAIIIIETPSITGAYSIQKISYLKEGNNFNTEIRNVENLKSFETTIIQDTKNSKILFEDIDSISWNFQGVVISMFKISSEDEEDFGPFNIELKIKEKNLKGLSPFELTLYHDGTALETTPGLKDGKYIHFKASSQGFGEFLIGKIDNIKVVEGEEIQLEIKKQPSVMEELKNQPVIQEPKNTGFFNKIFNYVKKFLNIY